jgi:hypothetical protein
MKNPLANLSDKYPSKIFQISEPYGIYFLWYLSNGLFHIKIYSTLICSFEVNFEGKIYMEDNIIMKDLSITYHDSGVNILREYGKYTKIKV